MAQLAGHTSNWYTNAYSGTFRTTRLRAPSLLPGGHRPIVTVQQTLVVDAARQTGNNEGKEENKNVRRRETIFGPDVGEDDEPGWTKPEEGAKVGVDVVKGWVERAKSEEGLHATTTLQALVNLKRPTLLLQQLDNEPSNVVPENEIAPASETDSRRGSYTGPPLHTLKFNYDATAPQVNITLSIYPNPSLPVEGKDDASETDAIKVIYNGIHPGGFNQLFTLPSKNALDLSSTVAPMPVQPEDLPGENNKQDNNDAYGVRESEDTTRSSIDRSTAMHHRNSTQAQLETVNELEVANPSATETRPARRFGLFGRRNRVPDVEEATPNNIELTEQNGGEGEKQPAEEKEPERGMRLLIKIDALGENGQALPRKNSQLTHILINGMWVSESSNASGKRVWLVKVVRREAVIGAHTFLLKEIYGLSSSSSTQAQSSSYPPTAGAVEDPYASTPNECIVCLTMPRDVVLLPCRHLVVCRDCAVGMVEFGAGGKVGRREDGTAEPGAEGAAGDAPATGAAAPAPAVAGGTTVAGRERRKKKPKGWYCPVCRQPYTSLLRLALPTSDKPARTPAASRMASRAASVRSLRLTHSHHGDANSLRRVPSHAPTLPDGAERMLESLRPAHASDDEDEDEVPAAGGVVPQNERPQFVLGNEVDAEDEATKREIEHAELVEAREAAQAAQNAKEEAEEEARKKDMKKVEDGMEEIDLGAPISKRV